MQVILSLWFATKLIINLHMYEFEYVNIIYRAQVQCTLLSITCLLIVKYCVTCTYMIN